MATGETKRLPVSHPVYPVDPDPDRVDRLREAVSAILAMPEPDMVALVPDRTGFEFMDCPNCEEGTQERQLSWSIDDPHRVRCRYCGMVYPNETYPEDRKIRIVNPVGREVVYPYWENEQGHKLLFTARAWRAARVYFASRAEDLAELYQVTKDLSYARRAVLMLDAFARHYPGFLVSRDWPHEPKGFALDPPPPNGGGKWGRWASAEVPSDVVHAYDWICESGELERLSSEVGVDVGARIEDDFFRGCIRQNGLMGPTYANSSPAIYEGYAVMGRVMGDPSLVHEAVRRSKGLFERRSFVDGFWCEGSVGYHQYAYSYGMGRVFRALKGYSDPPDYVDEIDGSRFDDLDLERDIPIIGRASRIPGICRYPDGRTMPVHDNVAEYRNLEVPERSAPTLLNGMGHAWLGRGQGDDQQQAHLHFSGGYGHDHGDNLNLALFAKGHELFPDLGYTHTRFRTWNSCTLSHNTVLIDEKRQYTRDEVPKWGSLRPFEKPPSDGRLLAYEAGYEPVRWVEASAEWAYPGLAEVYRRAIVQVAVDEGDAYLIDVFRVKGGAQHDWALHGSADHDSTATVDVPLARYGGNLLPGVKVRYPLGEADRGEAEGRNPSYAFFQNVSRGEVEHGLTLTFEVSDSPVGARTHLPGQPGAEVFLGDAMSFRRAEENDALLDEVRMPIVLLRRSGVAPLTSRFAAVHEPYEGGPFLDDVMLETAGEDGEAVVFTARHSDFTDRIIHCGTPCRATSDGLDFRGVLGFIRERAGRPEAMGLWGGTELRWAGWTLTCQGIYEAEVTGTLSGSAGDDVLIALGALPEGRVLAGATALVRFGDGSTRGYPVSSVEAVGGRAHVHIEGETGFVVEGKGARHLYFPHREMAGPVTCRIQTSALVTFAAEGKPELSCVGEAELASP
ncbi:MAG: heparinase II/III family protein [Candidatus Latescibacteria bacterium]|nr:heparinase II/III family protein [Candidatus Latescibacterota bacterium]